VVSRCCGDCGGYLLWVWVRLGRCGVFYVVTGGVHFDGRSGNW
jgi:hypothetical protein